MSQFATEADRHGLSVPGFDHTWVEVEDVIHKFDEQATKVFAGSDFFPAKEWRPLFGMAQHYGVPTRLLDWSESPLVAAYFAARDADETERGKCIEIWALNFVGLKSIATPDERIDLVRPPWSTNPNLRAQRGLFTLHCVRLSQYDTPKDVPLDRAVQELAHAAYWPEDKPLLYRLRLPVEKAWSLIYLLNQEGISAASMFPGYAGAVEGVRESWKSILGREP